MRTQTNPREIVSPSMIRASEQLARGLSALGLAAALSVTVSLAAPAAPAPHADDTVSAGQTGKAVLSSLQTAFSNVADELEPAVVTVSSSKVVHPDKEPDTIGPLPNGAFRSRRPKAPMMGTGSGVIIRKDGWILTNDHV